MAELRLYGFKSLNMPVLTSEVARTALKAWREGLRTITLTYNLGLSRAMVELTSEGMVIEGRTVSYDELQLALRDEDALFIVEPHGRLRKAILYSEGRLYKLKKVVEDGAPTLEVSGVPIHRIEGTKPWEDAIQKVSLVKVEKGARVLDLCTGLGYTAIASMISGASEVWTIEKDANVLRMAEANPWSRGLEDPRIVKVLGDVTKVLANFSEGEFKAVIHDPPSITQASELYTVELYREIHRLLEGGGRLAHFVGPTVSRARGMDLMQAVSKRLKSVGFMVKVDKEAMGVLAIKE
ncbi:MAG: RsmD family RNA methyltransferase [Candidatus Nezhaarchaeota archaeon]|nr:RsmD family RNA methyltransferase [Candidatus Nezhaarchaeota archaeon]